MPSTTLPLSAVQDMTVAEVRKALHKMRQLWFKSTPNNPLFICSILVGEKTIADFCTEFVYGHHMKRHYKSTALQNIAMAFRNTTDSAASDEDSYISKTAIAGPKGDLSDPFPFTPGWKPTTIVLSNPTDMWWDPSVKRESIYGNATDDGTRGPIIAPRPHKKGAKRKRSSKK